MDLKDALGLGPASQRVTVPARTWVAVAVALAVVAVAGLLASDVTAQVAVPVGVVLAIVLSIPVATLLTARRRGPRP
jgi:hypothetical protein